jgi:hypothetical protein
VPATEEQAAETTRASPEAVYVYGVTRAGVSPGKVNGLGDAALNLVEHGELAALASDAPGLVRAKRRDVLRHAEVLQAALAHAVVLPLAFGTVFSSRDNVVEEFLAPRYEELVELLHRFDGLVELSVRAFYREEEVLAAILREDRRLAELREATLAPRAPQAAQVQLGEGIARRLEARRLRDADGIVSSLVPLARDVVVEERRTEYEVLRGAFLVDADSLERFDARMNDLAREHASLMLFKYTGPLAPHSFVSVSQGRRS